MPNTDIGVDEYFTDTTGAKDSSRTDYQNQTSKKTWILINLLKSIDNALILMWM